MTSSSLVVLYTFFFLIFPYWFHNISACLQSTHKYFNVFSQLNFISQIYFLFIYVFIWMILQIFLYTSINSLAYVIEKYCFLKPLQNICDIYFSTEILKRKTDKIFHTNNKYWENVLKYYNATNNFQKIQSWNWKVSLLNE